MTTPSRSRPAAVIFDIGGTILEERWWDLKAALRVVVPDARLVDALSLEFQHLVSEQHRADREVALAGWLLARLPQITLALEELEDELWRRVVELVPFGLLKITPETELELSTDGERLVITPLRTPSARKAALAKAQRRVVRDHDETFRKLAK